MEIKYNKYNGVEDSVRIRDKRHGEITVTFFDGSPIGIWIARYDKPSIFRIDVDIREKTFNVQKFKGRE